MVRHASLHRIVFLRLKGLFFEFSNNNETTLLNAQTLQPTNLALGQRSQQGPASDLRAKAAAREQVDRLWADIQREISMK